MPEQLGYVEKISCAAAKIENALGARQIEFDLANPANIDSDPTFEIEIFRPICAGICNGVAFPDVRETNRIDCFDNPLCIKREPIRAEKPERMFPRAGQALAIYQLSYLMAKSHLKMNHTL